MRRPSRGQRGSGNLFGFLIVLLASSATVFVGMMFATGVAQRGVLPRMRNVMKKPPPPAEMPAAKPPAPPSVVWRAAEAGSLSVVRQRLEEEARRLEEEMARLRAALEARAAEIRKVREETDPEKRIQQMAKIYAGMKPADAARVLMGLDDAEAELLLTRLPARQASRILGNLDPRRAARLTRLVLGLEASHVPEPGDGTLRPEEPSPWEAMTP
jgi:hypothetical protein